MPLYKERKGTWRCDKCDGEWPDHTRATMHECVSQKNWYCAGCGQNISQEDVEVNGEDDYFHVICISGARVEPETSACGPVNAYKDIGDEFK